MITFTHTLTVWFISEHLDCIPFLCICQHILGSYSTHIYFSTFRRNSGEQAVDPLPTICAVLYCSKLQEKAVQSLGTTSDYPQEDLLIPWSPRLAKGSGEYLELPPSSSAVWSRLVLIPLSPKPIIQSLYIESLAPIYEYAVHLTCLKWQPTVWNKYSHTYFKSFAARQFINIHFTCCQANTNHRTHIIQSTTAPLKWEGWSTAWTSMILKAPRRGWTLDMLFVILIF